MSGERYFAEIGGSGAALVDYDNDGDLDVYLVQGEMLGDGLPATLPPPAAPGDRLFRNDPVAASGAPTRARFVDVTERAGVRARGYGMGVAAGDIDNDGWVDLYVTNLGPNQMLRNRGDGTFVDVTVASATGDPGWSISAAFVDLDLDGWLDLYVANYTEYRLALDKACYSATGARDYCSPLAYQPQPDRLYRNRRDGSFEDVGAAFGIASPARNGLGVATGDFDADGRPDLYVANDQMPNTLWLNRGPGAVSDGALLAGCAVNEVGLAEASMGVAVADFDGDGSDDVFTTHLSGETNTLYLNDGAGFFTDASRPSGLGNPSWMATGFGIGRLDYDLDGRIDLYVANGAVTVIEELARQGSPYPLAQRDQLFRNVGGGRFEETTAVSGAIFDRAEVGRGVAAGDLDLDGDTDLVVINNSGPAWYLDNRLPPTPRLGWLGLRALERPAGRDATGALVSLRAGDLRATRRIATDGSYASSSAPQASFGLGVGAAGTVDAVRVAWPDGGVTEWRGLPTARNHLVVREGGR
jgi:hypothetical protein